MLHGCQNKADPCRILAASSAAARCKIGLGKIKLANHSLVSSDDVTVMSLSTLYIVTLLVLQRATLSSFNWNLVELLRGSQICFLALSHWGQGPLFFYLSYVIVSENIVLNRAKHEVKNIYLLSVVSALSNNHKSFMHTQSDLMDGSVGALFFTLFT